MPLNLLPAPPSHTLHVQLQALGFHLRYTDADGTCFFFSVFGEDIGEQKGQEIDISSLLKRICVKAIQLLTKDDLIDDEVKDYLSEQCSTMLDGNYDHGLHTVQASEQISGKSIYLVEFESLMQLEDGGELLCRRMTDVLQVDDRQALGEVEEISVQDALKADQIVLLRYGSGVTIEHYERLRLKVAIKPLSLQCDKPPPSAPTPMLSLTFLYLCHLHLTPASTASGGKQS